MCLPLDQPVEPQALESQSMIAKCYGKAPAVVITRILLTVWKSLTDNQQPTTA
jgi:hypothetical protein